MGRGKFLRSLRQRWWLVAVIVLPITVGVLLYVSTRKARFEGFVTVADKRDKDANLAPLYPDQAMFAVNELEIRVANLANTFGSYTVIKNAFDQLVQQGVLTDSSEAALREFANKVDIRPLRGSEYIQVGYESEDPEKARTIIKTLYEKFNTHFQNLTADQGKGQVEFVQAQLAEQKDLLNAKLQEMKEFQDTHPRAIAYEQNATGIVSRQNQVEERLATARDGLAAAIGTLEASKRQAKDPITTSTPTASIQQAPNPLWNSITERIKASKTLLASSEETLGPNHPKIVQLKESIANDERLLAEKDANGKPVIDRYVYVTNDQQLSPMEFDRRRALQAAQRAYDSAVRAVAQNEAELQQVRSEIAKLPEAQKGLVALNADLTAISTSVANLGNKLLESKVRSGQNSMRNVALLDAWQVQQLDPGVVLKTLIAFFLSLIVAVSLVASLGQFDQATYTPADAENTLGFPVLAALPKSGQQRLDTGAEAPTPLAASYQLLSTQLLMIKEKLQGPCVLVASAEPNAGRSTIAANLAISLARDGARVLFVDADLRSPTAHEHFGLQNRTGLAELLSGQARLEDVVQKTSVEGLLFVAAGTPPVNPVRLLRGEAMEHFIADVSKQADYVVLDSPAGSTFGDAAVLADYTRNVVLVHEAGRAATGAEFEFHKALERLGANVIGLVLNKTRPEDCPSYSHFRRNYEASISRYQRGGGRPALGSGEKPVRMGSDSPPAPHGDEDE